MQIILIFIFSLKGLIIVSCRDDVARCSIDNNMPTAPPLAPRMLLELQPRHSRRCCLTTITSAEFRSVWDRRSESIWSVDELPAPLRLLNTTPTSCFLHPPKYSPHSVSVEVKTSSGVRRVISSGCFCVSHQEGQPWQRISLRVSWIIPLNFWSISMDSGSPR